MKPLTTYKQSILDYDTLDRSTISTSMNLEIESQEDSYKNTIKPIGLLLRIPILKRPLLMWFPPPHFTRSKPYRRPKCTTISHPKFFMEDRKMINA